MAKRLVSLCYQEPSSLQGDTIYMVLEASDKNPDYVTGIITSDVAFRWHGADIKEVKTGADYREVLETFSEENDFELDYHRAIVQGAVSTNIQKTLSNIAQGMQISIQDVLSRIK